MYNLIEFGSMIAESARMQAYAKAITQSVKPGSIVIDIGTGTGVLAFLACKLGAKFVYVIEPNDLIDVAKDMADANGFSSKIRFIKDVSTNTDLDEKADVIVSDLKGALPFYGQHIPSIIDARIRLLKPGGILIPIRDTIWISVVESSRIYRDIVNPWEQYRGLFDMNIARTMAVNYWIKSRAKPREVLTQPAKWATLDYLTIQSPNVAGHITQKALRSGVAHGLMIWFDAELCKGIWFHNTPGIKAHPKVYGSAFFPLQNPVRVGKGDKIDVAIKATLVDDEYIWNWDTRITGNNGEDVTLFKQSTFYSQRLSLSDLRKNDLAYIPAIINIEGQIDKFIINKMNGSTSIEKIAQKVIKKFPGKFKGVRDASERVSKLAKKYGE